MIVQKSYLSGWRVNEGTRQEAVPPRQVASSMMSTEGTSNSQLSWFLPKRDGVASLAIVVGSLRTLEELKQTVGLGPG